MDVSIVSKGQTQASCRGFPVSKISSSPAGMEMDSGPTFTGSGSELASRSSFEKAQLFSLPWLKVDKGETQK